MKKPVSENKKELGITAEKDEFSDWFTQLIQKAELIEYTNVSGCYIYRPRAYFMWEKVKDYFDNLIKKDGVKNAYFPLFIPKSNLIKEKDHVQGFSPEVAWVTKAGNTQLAEELAVRPTSETIMYPSYAKWIRSWRDLPLRINQWANVVRWEFKNPVPFIRSREFLWQEGHTCFATREEAAAEDAKILDFYAQVYKEVFAVPVIKGKKTDKEKFAGAEYTLTVEAFTPSGKSAQGATSHLLGQNFAKAFNIKFKDKDGTEKYPWQNSWGISTRSIGVAIMMHSDSKGLVLSPRVADTQIVIIPIGDTIKEAEKLKKELKDFRVEIDSSDKSPGFKFNEWEMKGIPLRIEIGPRDLKEKKVVLVRRDNGQKIDVKISGIEKEVPKILEDIHNSLYKKAEKYLKENTVEAKKIEDIVSAIKNKKLVKAEWCSSQECEDIIKSKTGGAKILCITDEKAKGKCAQCSKKADSVVYIAKSY